MATIRVGGAEGPRRNPFLIAFYRESFLPDAQTRLTPRYIHTYNQAVAAFTEFAGNEVKLGDITEELLAAFIDAVKPGQSANQRRDLAGAIRQVVLAWNAKALFKPRQKLKPLSSAKARTVRGYFERCYTVEAMVDAKESSVETTRITLRMLQEFAGRDIELTEQTDKLAADFFRWLMFRKLKPATINRYRRTWFAVWRHAFEAGLVKRPPKVKRLRETHDPPDSWSVDELKRLVVASRDYRRTDLYGDVRCNLWWEAILLVAWYTGLRRSSLLSIRREHFDLKTGVLYVPGENMKNNNGQVFQCGPDAIAAVENIWLPRRVLLFPTHHVQSWMSKHFAELVKLAGIPAGRRKNLSKFHKLRRSVATEIAARAGTAAASALLGHSSSYVTKLYIDPSKLPGHDVTKILPALSAG